MFAKIFSFSHRKTGKKALENDLETTWLLDSQSAFPLLEPSDIRVLVFRDCDRKGKTLLFDSKVANKQNENSQGSSSAKIPTADTTKKTTPGKSDEGKCPRSKPPHKSRKPSHDSKMLGEMLFGSVAMAYKGSTVKVHLIRSPRQLLLSKVFALKPRLIIPHCCSEPNMGSYTSNTSLNTDSILDDSSSRIETDSVSLSSQNGSPKDASLLMATSHPMAVPGTPAIPIEPEEDSGFMASIDSNSFAGSMTSLYTPSSSPCGSFQRRLYRSQVTSIDSGFNSRKRDDVGEMSPVLRRQPKIGLGIIFPLSDSEDKSRVLQGYFFSHFPLLESHVHRLRVAVESAAFSKKSFSSLVEEAVENFCKEICGELVAPRLKEPVWLNMMTFQDHRTELCEKFMDQFNTCLSQCNNRETSFFLASLLTAVLTHHLAWVPTVMPAGAAPSRTYLDKHSSKTLDLLAQSHPYNPLWAQLSDLYGAIGSPLKLSRTIVVGKNSKLVNQVIYILSYFIRCTEVFEHTIHCKEPLQTIADVNIESCCFCKGDITVLHEHNICSSCMEESGIGICAVCRKITLQELDSSKYISGKSTCSLDQILGIPTCVKCGLLQRAFDDHEIIRTNSMNGNSGCLPKWAVAKEFRHFQRDLSYCERSETFRCYCCEKPEREKSSFTCYCPNDNCVHKSFEQDSSHCNDLPNEPIENFTTFIKLLSHDMFCKRVECKCDKEDNQDSLESKDASSGETVASYGRSGSADSGFHQMNSECVTPGRRAASIDQLSVDTLENVEEFGPEELAMLGMALSPESSENPSKCLCSDLKKSNSFGRSLFAGFSETYHPDFVLQGLPSKDFLPSLYGDLRLSLQHSVIDDPVTEAVCIIADTDTWTCELISANKSKRNSSSEAVTVQPIEVSNLIFSMLSSVSGLSDVRMSAEFCLMHLEDRLKEIYLKSKVVSEWLRDRKRPITKPELAKTLGIDDSDMMLLLAVASAHAPQGVACIRH
ncbi:folliculin-interacting protein 1 [Nematostella vectensis]|uniref:folliculin-interacting protein 1 n=1 Tax=Nematostella vectensis TaxID=45351 RepID=UPI0020777D14|nr:folliculin-interacting protein 1 [Nematostella vectensis]